MMLLSAGGGKLENFDWLEVRHSFMRRNKNPHEMRKKTDWNHIPLFIHNLSSVWSFSFWIGNFLPICQIS
jgi:hypothetical protein